MPLANYGVLIGTLYTTAEQTEQGNWFHGVYYLSAPGSPYPFKCTTDFSSWYIGAPIFVFSLIAALALWGCYTALAGQKLVKEHLFE